MEDLIGMAIFARVVQAKSFTAAARQIGLSPSAISKHISNLENHLNTQLLQRSTRQLALTETGASCYEHCAQILTAAEAAELAVSQSQAGPCGVVKLGAPTALGLLLVAPALPQLLARHPELQVDLTLTDQQADLIADTLDVVIRVGDLPSSALRARRLTASEDVVCASPDYLARHTPPQIPEELKNHQCLALSCRKTSTDWCFHDPLGGRVAVSIVPRMQANNSLALRTAVLAGTGIAMLPRYVVHADLEAGRLQGLLAEYRSPAVAIHALYLNGRHIVPKVRVLIDFLVEQLSCAQSQTDTNRLGFPLS